MEPAYIYYAPYISNEQWQKQTQDSKYWNQLEKEQEKAINDVTSKNTSSEGKIYEQTAWQKAAAKRFASSFNINNPTTPSTATPPIQSQSNTKSDNIQGKKDEGTQSTASEQESNLFKSLLSSISEKGLWEDYSGSDRSFRIKDEDGKVKYDWGAGALNTLGNVSKYGAMAMSFVKDKEMANNTVNDTATSVRKTAQSVLLSTGNPIAMAIGAGSMLSDKVGGTASATKGLGTGNDIGNFLASQVPFLGFAGRKMGKQFESDELKGSSMYAWNSTADGLFGGSILFGKNKATNLTQTNNMQRSLATNILKDAKLDFIGAHDPRYYMAAQNELNGGYNQVGVAKQGAVFQFTKRTLSKHKIKKQQDGGKVQQGRTLDELVDYVEQQNPPFWKRMSGQDRNYIANDDGSVSSLRMTYSEGKEEPYVDVYPLVQYDLNGNLKYYFDPNEAYAMAKLRNDVVRMSREEAKRFTEGYKDSTKLKSYYRNYHPTQVKLPKEAWSWEYKTLNGAIPENEEIIEEFKEGGKVNVIPDGALHKNKHHLEEVDEKFEDVTTKGIPVIVESEDGEVIQQAEVEREEIIFRLEVTKKLEELSKKHTDEAAIEAGKLLVKEILYNTEDNTGKMI